VRKRNFTVRIRTPAKLTQSLTEAEREIVRQLKALSDIGQAPAIEVLARLFGLTSFERDVLLVCLAPGIGCLLRAASRLCSG